MPGAFLQQPCAAMDAHVAEGAQHAVVGPDREDLGAGDLGGDVVARRGNLRRRPEQLPRPPEDALPLRLMGRGSK